MKRRRTFIIMGGMIAVLSIAAIALLKTRTISKTNEKVQIVDVAEKDVKEIRFFNGEGTYSILADDTAYSLSDPWAKYAVDVDRLSAAVRNLSQITGERIADEVSEAYGLSDPETIVEVITGQNQIEITLGIYNESMGMWYLQKQGDPSVYVVSAGTGQWLTEPAYSYLDRTLIDKYDRNKETLTERLRKLEITRADLKEPIVIEAIDETPAAYTSAYEIISPVHVKTSYQVMNDYIGALLGMEADAVGGIYDATMESIYGFDSPTMKMTVDHDGIEEVFTIGKEKEDGVFYMMTDRNDLLYTISEVKLSFLHVTVDDLFFGLAIVPDINSVQEVEVILEGEKYDFMIDFDNSGNIEKVRFENEDLDEEQFRDFYSLLIAVDVQELSEDSAEGESVLSIIYDYKDGRSDRIDAYPLGARDMLLALNGNVQFKGRIAFLDKLSTELQHLLSGEAVNTDW